MADNSKPQNEWPIGQLFDDNEENWYELEDVAPMEALAPPPLSVPVPVAVFADDGSGLSWPPGLTGEIARYMHQASFMPVKEVSITAALALLAGVCGRAYCTYTKADLALYLLLVADIGSGKDAIHSGIPLMLGFASREAKSRFLQHTEFVSGQALHKAILETPGFLNLEGEIGKKLKRMDNPADGPMTHFRTTLLNAYSKREFQGRRSMSEDNSSDSVRFPALSLLGETNPSTFYEALTTGMMEDGFLSRFTVIFAEDDNREPNCEEVRQQKLDEDFAAYWKALVGHAYDRGTDRDRIDPQAAMVSVDAEEKLEGIRRDYDAKMKGKSNAEKHLLVRAHLKVLKIASLLAVADNYTTPVVRIGHVAWARGLVERDIAAFTKRSRGGDVGTDDNARERKLVALLRDYIGAPIAASYKVSEEMRSSGIVPHQYLSIRIRRQAAFYGHKLDANRALSDTIRSMIDQGYLMEVDKAKAIEAFGYNGRCYRITRLPDYGT